jgi:selT/selW/selH-like putative selenoprotein
MMGEQIVKQFPNAQLEVTHYGNDPDSPTGAFEIFVNGKLIHSKLATRKFPSTAELIAAIRASI